MNIYKTIVTLLAITLTTATAQADVIVSMSQSPHFPGWTSYHFLWNGHGTEYWSSASLLMDLSQGEVFNHEYPDYDFGIFRPDLFPTPIPELRFDTRVGPATVGIAGGAADLGGGPFSLDAPQVSVSWFNTEDSSTTQFSYTSLFSIAQITVSNDAMGTWKILANPGGEILEGVIIPEPATLALFALVVSAMLRRR